MKAGQFKLYLTVHPIIPLINQPISADQFEEDQLYELQEWEGLSSG